MKKRYDCVLPCLHLLKTCQHLLTWEWLHAVSSAASPAIVWPLLILLLLLLLPAISSPGSAQTAKGFSLLFSVQVSNTKPVNTITPAKLLAPIIWLPGTLQTARAGIDEDVISPVDYHLHRKRQDAADPSFPACWPAVRSVVTLGHADHPYSHVLILWSLMIALLTNFGKRNRL